MSKSLKIRKSSAADLVCERIKELVSDGFWKVNDKIPSEADLAESFGVNRLTVRIALQRLNALGLLETRVGDGTYVRDFDFEKHLSQIADFYVNDKVMKDTLEFRALIELAAADLAIERCQEQTLEAMRSNCEAFEKELKRYDSLTDFQQKEQCFIQTVDLGLAIQTELVNLSDNTLLSYAFSLAKEPIRKHMLQNAQSRITDRAENHLVWVKAYWDLYEGLKNHNRDQLRQGLKNLINVA